MPEPLLSEDTDLARLIAGIRTEHGDAATILYHDCVRRGGVMGFFAREVHRVAYRVEDSSTHQIGQEQAVGAPTTADADPLAALIGLADAADGSSSGFSSGSSEGSSDGEVRDGVAGDAASYDYESDDFAAILRRSLSAEPEADPSANAWLTLDAGIPATGTEPAPDIAEPARDEITERHVPSWFDAVQFPSVQAGEALVVPLSHSVAETSASASPEVAAAATYSAVSASSEGRPMARRAARRAAALAKLPAPADDRRGLASVTPLVQSPARARLDALLGLRRDGSLDPAGSHHAHELYRAVDEALAELPDAPDLPRSAGDVLALVGPLTPTLATAVDVAAQLRIPETDIWIAGLPGHPASRLVTEGWQRSISGVGDARLLRSDLRTNGTPSIVVIATDAVGAELEDPWAGELVTALEPTATWLVLDATSKPEDALSVVQAMPTVDALAVHSVRLSKSPATVWDIGLPVALVDGRRADTFAWAMVLFGALRSERRRRASA